MPKPTLFDVGFNAVVAFLFILVDCWHEPQLLANSWQIRCAVNTMKALLPFQVQLRALKRKLISAPHVIEDYSVYTGGFEHIEALREAGLDLENKRVLELGTGRFPVVPLLFRLAGANHVYLTDIERLLDRSTILSAVDFLLEKKEDVAQQLKIDIARIDKLLTVPHGLSTDELLWWFGLTYLCPFDASRNLPAAVDCIVSHTVLEHIPKPVLAKFFRDTKHCGLQSHGIDHTDHRAHRDRRLNYIDFLRYSDRTWRLFCINQQDYTNRLRHSDYVAMLNEAGYKILQQRKYVHNGVLAEAGGMQLWGRYRDMSVDELATTYSHIVVRPQVSMTVSRPLWR